jgi:hypothetical protein
VPRADTPSLRQRLKDLASSIDQDEWRDAVLSRPELGAINFSQVSDEFTAMRRFYGKVKQVEWSITPPDNLPSMVEKTEQLISCLTNIKEFTLTGARAGVVQDVTRVRDSIRDDFTKKWQEAYRYIQPHLVLELEFVDVRSTEYTASLVKELDQMKALKGEAETILSQAKKRAGEIDKALEIVRKAAEEAGIAKEATHFRRAAKWSTWTAVGAFALACCFGVSAFFIGSRLLANYGPHPTVALWLYWGLPRFFLLSLLFTGLIFALRQFSAACHNVVVNRHRQNALSTFQTFVAAAGDDKEVKHAILLQATQAIFAPQQSGYLKNESDGPSANRLTEVITREVGRAALTPDKS